MVAHACTVRQASKEMCSAPSPLVAAAEVTRRCNSRVLERLQEGR